MDERIAREVARYMDRAAEALRLAETLRDEFPPDAVARSYYAMFYAVTAALLSDGVRRRKHSGVMAAFGERFVKPGLIDRAHQQAFARAFEDREVADYEAFAQFGPARVAGRIAQARAFVEAVRGLLASRGLSLEGG
jgi:uncharacterized protein (UPF0332 family)